MNFKILLCLIGLAASQAYAEAIPKNGFLDLTVFKEGALAQDEVVKVDEKRHETNEQGFFQTQLSPGSKTLQIQFEGAIFTQEVKIVSMQTTVVLINLQKGFAPYISVEVPEELEEFITSVENESSGELLELEGKVLSLSDRSSIEGARVYIQGEESIGISDEEGQFKIKLRTGSKLFSVVHPKFNTLSRTIPVSEGSSPLNFTLTPTGIKLDEFVVTAPHIKGSMASLMDNRKLSTELVDVIGVEQMKKAGDSNAASAIRRVTGLTLVDSKYPYIRGMGGRYVTTFLNGFHLPSPDPSKRVVPLDMFPTGILESINVLKTSKAQSSAEFGGGHIRLKTTSLPEEFFVKASMSASGSGSAEEGLTYNGGKADWLGFDDGTRKLPGILRVATKDNRKLTEQTITNPEGFTPEQLSLIGESLRNNYNVEETTLPINRGGSLSLGDGYSLGGDSRFGWLASGIYGDEWENNVQRKAKFQAPEYTKDPYYQSEKTERLVKVGLSGSLGVDISKNHEIRVFNSLLRRTTDETYFAEGSNQEWDGPFQSYFLKWQERQMHIKQFWGSHTFDSLSDFNVQWRIGSADAKLYQPDTREYRYERNNDKWEFSSRKGGNKRNYTSLFDTNDEYGIDLSLPIKFGDSSMEVKTGIHKVERTRDGKTRRYGFGLQGTLEPNLLNKDLESILTDENINESGFVLKELTQASDSYTGTQEVDGVYGQVNIDLFKKLNLSMGMRQETSNQNVETFNLHDKDSNPIIANLENTHMLPSFNSTWKFNDRNQIRFSYSKSLARPDFRELSPTPYIDDESGDEVIGNPDLETTTIDSYDTRWEWYGHANESVSIAFFYKNFKSPIEVSLVNGTNQLKYDVAAGAETFGAEVEWHKNLSFLGKWATPFKTGGNIAIMNSEIVLSDDQKGIQTNKNRPLQGQSPYAVNLYLFYENLRTDTEMGFLFNQMGPRISNVGEIPFDDTYEQPLPQLDFTFGQAFQDSYKVIFKVKNILDADVKFKQEGRETVFKEKTREYSMGLSASF